MTERATWLADVLRAADVGVKETLGWKANGRPTSTGWFFPRAVMWHHDASAKGDFGGPAYILAGRPSTGDPGPLAQAWVDRYGCWTLIAAGRCNHGGDGDKWGVIPKDEANTYAIGVETDHTVGEAWPDAQLDGLRRGTAAILAHMKAKPGNALLGHKEYAPTRKVDPAGLDMDAERRTVAALMDGDDMPTPKDLWNYEIDNKVEQAEGRGDGKMKAGDALSVTHKRTYDLVKLVAAQQSGDQASIEAALPAVLGSLDD